jgi:hypothetical protein
MRPMLTPAGSSVVLAGLALLFCANFFGLGSAAVLDGYSNDSYSRNVSSLDDMKAFHQHFKSPSYSVAPAKSLAFPLMRDGQKEVFANATSCQGQGIVALNDERIRDIRFEGSLEPASSKINHMNIDLSHITVIAVNMMEKGSASATSNIILSPVQYLGHQSYSEVDELLR